MYYVDIVQLELEVLQSGSLLRAQFVVASRYNKAAITM